MAVGAGFASRIAKNVRRMSGAGSRVGGALTRTFGGSSGTDSLARGLKGAWGGAGGGRSLARRAGIGAIAGGLTTGSISALRGDDFWEGAKSGATVGAGIGAARHGYKMGETLRGTGLKSNLASVNARGRSIGDNIRRGSRGRDDLVNINVPPIGQDLVNINVPPIRQDLVSINVPPIGQDLVSINVPPITQNRSLPGSRLFSMNESPTIRSHQVQARHPRSNPAVQAKASRAQLGSPGVSQQVKTLQRQFPTTGQAQSIVNRDHR